MPLNTEFLQSSFFIFRRQHEIQIVYTMESRHIKEEMLPSTTHNSYGNTELRYTGKEK